MSVSPKLNPIEIPEILQLVGCHLSEFDVKTCMVVSKTWNDLFCAYRWHHLVYNSQGIPHLEKYGHLVRSLQCHFVTEEDMRVMAGACHNVQKLRLEINGATSVLALEVLTSNMPFIQDLTLVLFHRFSMVHWVAISRLKHLRHLTLSVTRGNIACLADVKMLIKVLEECPLITSLTLHGLSITIDEKPEKRYEYPKFLAPVLSEPDEHFVKRWLRKQLYPHEFNPTIPSPEVKAMEPWRMFVRDARIAIPIRWNHESVDSYPAHFSKLTKLSLKHLLGFPHNRALSMLLKQLPNIEDLSVHFGNLDVVLVADCLDTIVESCHQIRVLKLQGLHKHTATLSSIHNFFKQHRRTLTDLTLEDCSNIDHVFELIPNETAAGLERISVDGSLSSDRTFHQFLLRCFSLKTFAWNCVPERRFNVSVTYPMSIMRIEPTPQSSQPPQQLDTMPEPWACYETIRSFEQTFGISTAEATDAYFSRLREMKHLVCLGLLLFDLRQLLACACKSSEDDPSSEYVHVGGAEDDNEEADQATVLPWCLPSIQELTLSSLSSWRVSSDFIGIPDEINPHLELTKVEVEQLLTVFPGLRKIRYRGYGFPLNKEARTWLKKESNHDISVVHVSQLPNSYSS